jgi:hypothetical protein
LRMTALGAKRPQGQLCEADFADDYLGHISAGLQKHVP